MSRPGSVKHFIFAFLIALVLYLVTFNFIEHRRTEKGPWEVAFTADSSSPPGLTLRETNLQLAEVRIIFPGETAAATNILIRFDRPQTVPFSVPFGECVFEDLIYQPGTVVFQMFGHEIQLLPRVLTIDKKEREWHSGETISLLPVATGKAAVPPGAANVGP